MWPHTSCLRHHIMAVAKNVFLTPSLAPLAPCFCHCPEKCRVRCGRRGKLMCFYFVRIYIYYILYKQYSTLCHAYLWTQVCSSYGILISAYFNLSDSLDLHGFTRQESCSSMFLLRVEGLEGKKESFSLSSGTSTTAHCSRLKSPLVRSVSIFPAQQSTRSVSTSRDIKSSP